MAVYYHATQKENVFSIMHNGIKAGMDGYTYLCKDENACLEFMELYHPEGGLFAVIPIELNDSEVEISHDHNCTLLPVDAFVYKGDIPSELIPKDLNQIHLYELQKGDEK